MKKTTAWIKSLAVTLMVTALMGTTGFFFFTGTNDATLNTSSMEAADYEAASASYSALGEPSLAEETITAQNNTTATENKETAPVTNIAAIQPVADKIAEASSPASVAVVSVLTADHLPAIEKTVVPVVAASKPAPVQETAVEVVPVTTQLAVSVAPVTYSWGSSTNYTFRMEVKVTNSGTDAAQNVVVSVPLLENSSPYQTTALKTVNYDIISSSGRVSNFDLGELAPGESKTITADFAIKVNMISIKSSNDTVETARKIYEKHAGTGNCRDLALGFINEARANGITAREVIGFARAKRGDMTSGSLQGSRHSWAEFYVDGLGWVPVDLTFKYFGAFPDTSHVVESYSDQSIRATSNGGNLGASWSNSIL